MYYFTVIPPEDGPLEGGAISLHSRMNVLRLEHMKVIGFQVAYEQGGTTVLVSTRDGDVGTDPY